MSLSRREKNVLAEVVRLYIEDSAPVSSAAIVRNKRLNISAATVRNIMSRLENLGYISQPHTSAGRVPETLAYRLYVDEFLPAGRLPQSAKSEIQNLVTSASANVDDLFKEISRILAQLSHQLGVIISPAAEEAIFDRMELIRLSSGRVLVIITVRSGLAKTIHLQIDSDISDKHMLLLSQVLNERLSGRKILDIQRQFADIVKDIYTEKSALLRVFVKRANQLFNFQDSLELFVMGTSNMLQQAELTSVRAVSSLMEMLERREIIFHLLHEPGQETSQVAIQIGEEIEDERLSAYSIVKTNYRFGTVHGTMGIVGPRSMDYSKIVPLVGYAAKSITSEHGSH